MYSRRLVFITACSGMLLFGISLITLGSVAQGLQVKFSLDGVGSGTLFSILPVGILTGSLLFGPISDKHGYKMLLLIGCVSMFAGFQGIAYSSSLMILKTSIYIFGIGGGIVNGATNAVVSDISRVNKGSNLSLLGVFFGLGAIGMPLILAMLAGKADPFRVVAWVGWLTLVTALLFAFIQFPRPKQQAVAVAATRAKLFNPILVLIAFFLFFQSSLEAIVNNWTTTYLLNRKMISETNALYALSVHMVGMIVMRLVTGTFLRKVSQVKIMWICLFLLAVGIILMQAGATQIIITAGLFLSGAGLAAGFPVMLGFVGERFASLSGTAFSFVFSVALVGNMLINYLMGIIVDKYGIQYLTTVCYVEIAIMAILFFFIRQKLKSNYK